MEKDYRIKMLMPTYGNTKKRKQPNKPMHANAFDA